MILRINSLMPLRRKQYTGGDMECMDGVAPMLEVAFASAALLARLGGFHVGCKVYTHISVFGGVVAKGRISALQRPGPSDLSAAAPSGCSWMTATHATPATYPIAWGLHT